MNLIHFTAPVQLYQTLTHIFTYLMKKRPNIMNTTSIIALWFYY